MQREEYFDLNLERAILNACLCSEDAYFIVSSEIEVSDFSFKAHQDIFSAMSSCVCAQEPLSESFLKKHKIISENVLEEIRSTPSVVDLLAHTKELREKSVKRQLLNFAQLLPSKINENRSVSEITDEISRELFELSNRTRLKDIRSVESVVSQLLDEFEMLKTREATKKGIIGLDTGFRKLNSLTKGFKEGELIIIAARPGMGKTSLCLNFIESVLYRENKGVVLFSLEMPAIQILQRMLAAKISVSLQKIIIGDLNDDEWEKIGDACNDLRKKEFYIYDSGYANLNDIRSILRKLKSSNDKIKLCVIDYIGLMMSTSSFSDRHLQVSEISRGLKLLARELDMPIIALSQLNRSLENRSNKRPMLSDLRESGAIEQDADTILFVYRDDVYREQEERERENKAKAENKHYNKVFVPHPTKENAEIIVGKNRNGPVDTVEVVFLKEKSSFKELDDKN